MIRKINLFSDITRKTEHPGYMVVSKKGEQVGPFATLWIAKECASEYKPVADVIDCKTGEVLQWPMC